MKYFAAIFFISFVEKNTQYFMELNGTKEDAQEGKDDGLKHGGVIEKSPLPEVVKFFISFMIFVSVWSLIMCGIGYGQTGIMPKTISSADIIDFVTLSLLFVLSIYTAVAFIKRMPNAVHLATAFAAIVILSKTISFISAATQWFSFRMLVHFLPGVMVWGAFIYIIYTNKQLATVFPFKDRKLYRWDIVLISLIIIPMITSLILILLSALFII